MQTLQTKFGTFTIDEIRDRWMYKNLTQKGGYQFEDIEAILPFVSGNAIDVGAHVGLFTVPISRAARHVWSIEGNPKTFATFQDNLKTNVCTNVTALNTIASEDSDEYQIVEMPHDAETQFQKGKGTRGTSLDSLTDEKIGFIKIDVEGMEPHVLRGAKRILKNDKPYIFIEINKQALKERGNSVSDIEPLLRGYDFYRFDQGFHKVFSLEQGALSNILAVPKGAAAPQATNSFVYLLMQVIKKTLYLIGVRQ